ncbi:uncharacterized protein LOC143913528 isoform X3 [Arctopsyche grandis]|uniref:uncharacterized protein LOC143913528 isoform X3 n=1 Tax=Arctopsyche grandis TaxID=121162 RepID=UPI00406DA386
MECRLCLCSAPPEAFISIHDDTYPPHLVQRIWTCCRLQVRKDDKLPDMICPSCVNNLELLDSFRNTCLRTDKASRLKSGESLNVKPEEVILADLIWEDEVGANLPPNISSSSNYGVIHKRNITLDVNEAEIISNTDIQAEGFPLPKTSDKTCSSHSKSFTGKHNSTEKPDVQKKLYKYVCRVI